MGAGRSNSIIVEIVGEIAEPAKAQGAEVLELDSDKLAPSERRLMDRILRRAVRRPAALADEFHRLTAREREIVQHVCEGLGNQETAKRLGISEATVRHHLTSVFAKVGVRDRVSLVIFYLRRRYASYRR